MKTIQKVEETEAFFNQWNIYQQIIKENYMSHNEVSKTLQNFLATLPSHSKHFLDLGCGDAFMASTILKNVNIEAYHGVDLSEEALKFAQNNLDPLSCTQKLINEDLSTAIDYYTSDFDIICAGYSLHHLIHTEKHHFFKNAIKHSNQKVFF